jgi:hypothetical protein
MLKQRSTCPLWDGVRWLCGGEGRGLKIILVPIRPGQHPARGSETRLANRSWACLPAAAPPPPPPAAAAGAVAAATPCWPSARLAGGLSRCPCVHHHSPISWSVWRSYTEAMSYEPYAMY